MDGYFEIHHFVHPEHPLTLINLKDSETRSLIETQKKINWEKRISDRLRQGLSDDDDDDEEEEEEEDFDVSISCVLCRNEILDISSYSCTICDVHMHKLCAKLPKQIMHPNHTKHPLTITDRKRFECDICSEFENGFSYCCIICNFDVDVKCASRAEAINYKGHPHPLYPVLRTAFSKCDACTTEHSAAGVSYMCNTCNFWVHEGCATLPGTVKYHGHVHPLSLVACDLSFGHYPTRCAICEQLIQKPWIYECDGCTHRVHLNCLATTLIAEIGNTYKVDPDIDLNKVFQVPESFQYDDLVGQMIKHMTIHYGETAAAFSSKVGSLSHFNHKHPLTLICNLSRNNNDRKNDDVVCNACLSPVLTPQVHYSCTVCNNYVLHEWCAKLPNELQHPSHPHPLILAGPGHKHFGSTVCPACEMFSNGFSYRCRDRDQCSRFAIDIKCLLPPAIWHKAHKHPLKLVQDCYKEGCVACPDRSDTLAYGCVSCCFYLHHRCALKPVTIVHRYDKHHPFNAIVETIENRADEYVCEFCEKDINPNWWFHHCFHCDFSACAECIFPAYSEESNLNLLLTYSSDIHDHPLSLVPVGRRTNTTLCLTCQRNFHYSGYALQCAQCKVMFHFYNCSTESSKLLFPLLLQEGPSYHQ